MGAEHADTGANRNVANHWRHTNVIKRSIATLQHIPLNDQM